MNDLRCDLRENMTISDLILNLQGRINPIYSRALGTESYERRLCVEALEAKIIENELLRAEIIKFQVQQDHLLSAIRYTLTENIHLADGDNCTLFELKHALETFISSSDETILN